MPTTQVAVCGPGHCTIEDEHHAFRVGQLLAERGVTVICGGGTGVMAAVARGVRSRNGVIIGVRPGPDKTTASADLSAVIVTNIGEARNAVIVWSADAGDRYRWVLGHPLGNRAGQTTRRHPGGMPFMWTAGLCGR